MGRRRDAVLALAALVGVAIAGIALDAPVTPLAVGVGAAGALAVEGLLSLRAARVRAVWDRPTVRLGSIVLLAVLAAVGLALVGPTSLTVLAAGLCAYLVLLGALTLLGR